MKFLRCESPEVVQIDALWCLNHVWFVWWPTLTSAVAPPRQQISTGPTGTAPAIEVSRRFPLELRSVLDSSGTNHGGRSALKTDPGQTMSCQDAVAFMDRRSEVVPDRAGAPCRTSPRERQLLRFGRNPSCDLASWQRKSAARSVLQKSLGVDSPLEGTRPSGPREGRGLCLGGGGPSCRSVPTKGECGTKGACVTVKENVGHKRRRRGVEWSVRSRMRIGGDRL